MVFYAQTTDRKGVRVKEIKSLDNPNTVLRTLAPNDGIVVEYSVKRSSDGREWLYSPSTNTYYEYTNSNDAEPLIHIFKTVSATIDPVCKSGLKLFSEPKMDSNVITTLPQSETISVTSDLVHDSKKNVFIQVIVMDLETETLKYKGWVLYRNYINNFNNIVIGNLPGMCTLDGDILSDRVERLENYIEQQARPRMMLFRARKATGSVKVTSKKKKKTTAADNKKASSSSSTRGNKASAKETKEKSYIKKIAHNHPSIVQNSKKFPTSKGLHGGIYKYDYNMNYSKDGLLKDMDEIYENLNIITRGINSTYKKNLNKYNRFKMAMPDDLLSRGFAHVFFTRPDCNILNNKRKLTTKPSKDPNFMYAYNHRPGLINNLCQGVGEKDDFNLFLSNKAQSFSLSDENITTDTYGTTFRRNGISFGRHSVASKAGGTFDIEYTDNRDLDVFHFHKLWIDYISNVYMGKWTPKMKYVYGRILDYACSVYYILTAEDGETILFWSKYYGVFPVNIPSSAYSWSKGNVITAPNLSIQYQYSYKEDFNPLSMIEFNINSLNGDLESGDLTYLTTYNENTGRLGNTWTGSPFIETIMDGKDSMNMPDYTMKLRFKKS